MTCKQWILTNLVERGLTAKNSEIIFQRIDDSNEFRDRWNDSVDDYPKLMMISIWMSVRKVALKWIDENMPQFIFRDMFVE